MSKKQRKQLAMFRLKITIELLMIAKLIHRSDQNVE